MFFRKGMNMPNFLSRIGRAVTGKSMDQHSVGINRDWYWGWWNGKKVTPEGHKQLVSNALAAGKKLAFEETKGRGNIWGSFPGYDPAAMEPHKPAYGAAAPYTSWEEMGVTLPPPNPNVDEYGLPQGSPSLMDSGEAVFTTIGGLSIGAVIVGIVAIGAVIYYVVFRKKDKGYDI
jgi:hypothetical protein